MSNPVWQDKTWQSADGLALHYRDYAGPSDRPPILCIHGLSRNARDFEPVAEAFASEWRVITVDLRGRGDSEYAKDSATYVPATYVADITALLDQLGLDKVIGLGTSLGGIIFALMAGQMPHRFAALAFNDIGPVIDPAGLKRISESVGHGRSFETWMHAARTLRESLVEVHPDFTISEWLRLTKRLMALGQSGRIAYDYDMRIADPMAAAEGEGPPELWPAFMALPDVPKLVLRGELSDILSAETVKEMVSQIGGMEAVTIARVGHVPTLDEPEALAAIAHLLERAG